MIFSSSIAGLSHTKEEDTPEEHLRMAADAFHRTCRRAIELVAAGDLDPLTQSVLVRTLVAGTTNIRT